MDQSEPLSLRLTSKDFSERKTVGSLILSASTVFLEFRCGYFRHISSNIDTPRKHNQYHGMIYHITNCEIIFDSLCFQRAVESTLREGISHLDSVDPQMTLTIEADIREEICKTITGIVANMENTANYYGTIWRQKLLTYYPSFTMDGLVPDIVEMNAQISAGYNVSYDTFQYNDTNPMWQLTPDSDNMTMDADTERDLTITRFNITLVRKICIPYYNFQDGMVKFFFQITVVLNQIYVLKSKVTDYVQARKVMGEAPSVLQTENITGVYIKTPIRNMNSCIQFLHTSDL